MYLIRRIRILLWRTSTSLDGFLINKLISDKLTLTFCKPMHHPMSDQEYLAVPGLH